MLEMINEVKVTDEEILRLWEKTVEAKDKAIKLALEAKVFESQAEYNQLLFWKAVGKTYGLNTSSAIWSYNDETQVVSRKDEDEHPLAKLLGGISGVTVEHLDDKSGTVI